MAHDANKVVLGATRNSFKVVSNRKGTIEAGLAVRLKNDNTISIAAADGSLLGVSLGKDLSDIGHTCVAREGLMVPVRVGAAVTIGKQAAVHDTTALFYDEGTATTTAVNAYFKTARIQNGGIKEDGTSVEIAFIDMVGGL